MKWWTTLAIFLLPSSQFAVAADKPITKELALKAIAAFGEDPISRLGRAAQSVVIKFSRDSPEVLITFTQKNYSISEIKGSEEEEMTLLAAFVVGNVDSQLARGSKKDGGYAGDLQLIRTYRFKRTKQCE